MFHQLSRLKRRVTQSAKRRGDMGREETADVCVCVGVCTVILSLAAEDFNLIYRWNIFAWWFIDLVCASYKSIHQTTAYTTMSHWHCESVCVCVCAEDRSQARVFVMSSLGSFWFNGSSLLFHAVLLSNSSGLVTTVLPPSFSTFFLPTHVHFLYFSSHRLSLLSSWQRPLLTCPPVSCTCKIKWGPLREGEAVEGACMNGHYWPIPFIPVRKGNSPKALHLTWLLSLHRLCGTTGPDVSALNTLRNYGPILHLSLYPLKTPASQQLPYILHTPYICNISEIAALLSIPVLHRLTHSASSLEAQRLGQICSIIRIWIKEGGNATMPDFFTFFWWGRRKTSTKGQIKEGSSEWRQRCVGSGCGGTSTMLNEWEFFSYFGKRWCKAFVCFPIISESIEISQLIDKICRPDSRFLTTFPFPKLEHERELHLIWNWMRGFFTVKKLQSTPGCKQLMNLSRQNSHD